MRKHLLVVDDDDSIRDLLGEFFSGEGFDVSTATNGRQALQRVTTNCPDVILMDLNMPVMDGVAAIRELKNDPETREIPTIAMSARPIIRARGGELLADGVITKPFDLRSLLNEVTDGMKSGA